jgi:hypothetical protein
MEWRVNECGNDAIYFRDVEVARVAKHTRNLGSCRCSVSETTYEIELVLPSIPRWNTKGLRLSYKNKAAAKKELTCLVWEWLEATGLVEKKSDELPDRKCLACGRHSSDHNNSLCDFE